MENLLGNMFDLSLQQKDNAQVYDETSEGGCCLYDLLQMESASHWGSDLVKEEQDGSPMSPQKRLEKLLSESGNDFCADCGSPDPKWVSFNLGVFICIKCSGVHRSLGAHISKILSVKLDDWTDEQVHTLMELGGNRVANMNFEASLTKNSVKPKPDATIEERTHFIKKKYVEKQFMNSELALSPAFSCAPSLSSASGRSLTSLLDTRLIDKPSSSYHIHGLGHAFRHHTFRHSRKKSEHMSKKSHSMAGMIEFLGLIKVNVVRGTNLAVRDMVSSDPYVILALGNQSMKTRVIKNSLNPVWNECLMLSIPEDIPPLKLLVYDKDKFSTDDFMGDAAIDIHPLVSAARALESSELQRNSNKESTRGTDGMITLEEGKVKQEVVVKLQNVERGQIEIGLECVPLTQ